MWCCTVIICWTKTEATTYEQTGSVAGLKVPLVTHAGTETSLLDGCCCMRPRVALQNRIPFVSQSDTLMLCRQRCGLHCCTANPGNNVNKELLLFPFLLFLFPLSWRRPQTRAFAEVKRARTRSREWPQQRFCNGKSRWLENNRTVGQRTSGPQPRGHSRSRCGEARCFLKPSSRKEKKTWNVSHLRDTTLPSG